LELDVSRFNYEIVREAFNCHQVLIDPAYKYASIL